MPYLFRRPAPGELVGTTQRKRAISRRYRLAYARDPLGTTRRNAERRVKRRFGWYSLPAKVLRLLLRVMR